MPLPSKISLLPKELRKQLQEWIKDASISFDEKADMLAEALKEEGLEITISRTAIVNYAQKMKRVGAKLRESREVAEAWAEQFGSVDDSNTTQLLIEIVRNLSFETGLRMSEKGASAKSLQQLADAIKKLEQAAHTSTKRITEAREQALKDACDAIKKAGKSQGVSHETIRQIEREVLGIDR